MDETRFDAGRFGERLTAPTLGRALVLRAEVDSTNDEAWRLHAAGRPIGTAVVAEVQTRGRGRAGRSWFQAPGRGLALSVLLRRPPHAGPAGLIPLAAGLALARGLEALGARASLKWPNDLECRGRKLAGLLAEARRGPDGADTVVLGAGVNVGQRAEDFPPELRPLATSLALEGWPLAREDVAAEFLNALEPRLAALDLGDGAAIVDEWTARAGFWGRPVTVRTPEGPVTGEARGLDPAGGLRLRLASGAEVVVVAGDLEVDRAVEGSRR